MSEEFPDVEGGLRTYLRADVALTTALGGQRVFMQVPDDPPYPCVTVARVGGGESATSDTPVDHALVSIECWGELDANGRPKWVALMSVVNAVRSALSVIRGRTTLSSDVDAFGVTVAGVVRAPDPDNGRPRYVVTAEVAAICS